MVWVNILKGFLGLSGYLREFYKFKWTFWRVFLVWLTIRRGFLGHLGEFYWFERTYEKVFLE